MLNLTQWEQRNILHSYLRLLILYFFLLSFRRIVYIALHINTAPYNTSMSESNVSTIVRDSVAVNIAIFSSPTTNRFIIITLVPRFMCSIYRAGETNDQGLLVTHDVYTGETVRYAQIKIAMCNRKSMLWGWSVILSAMYRVIVYSCVSTLQTLAL